MNRSVNERVKQVRKAESLTQQSFADKLSVKQGTISDIERGRLDVSDKIIGKISDIFKVRSRWLSTGKVDNKIVENIVYLDEKGAADQVNELVKDNRFIEAQKIADQVNRAHGSHFQILIPELNLLWKNIAVLMQFIDQYDKYLANPASIEIYKLVKNGRNPNEVHNYLNKLLNNIPHVVPILKNINKALEKNTGDLKKFDADNEIEKDYLQEYKRARNDLNTSRNEDEIMDIEGAMAAIERIFAFTEKEYS
jgi:transcriptional regulator with XRE-family HTH domain